MIKKDLYECRNVSVKINLLLFYLFFTIVPSNTCVFLSYRLFVANRFSTGLVGVEVSSVSWLGQLTVETEETSTAIRPGENVVLTMKGLQKRNTQVLDGVTVKNR